MPLTRDGTPRLTVLGLADAIREVATAFREAGAATRRAADDMRDHGLASGPSDGAGESTHVSSAPPLSGSGGSGGSVSGGWTLGRSYVPGLSFVSTGIYPMTSDPPSVSLARCRACGLVPALRADEDAICQDCQDIVAELRVAARTPHRQAAAPEPVAPARRRIALSGPIGGDGQ